jgi:hypothetical protein
VGTLANNRKGLPASFKRTDGRPEGDYVVLYDVSGKKSIHSWITNTKSGEFFKPITIQKINLMTLDINNYLVKLSCKLVIFK